MATKRMLAWALVVTTTTTTTTTSWAFLLQQQQQQHRQKNNVAALWTRRTVKVFKDGPVGSAVEQALDTVEDAVMHFRRMMVESELRAKRERSGKERVVLLGSGWAAHALMKVIDAAQFDVTVVSPTNHFLFTPMLPSAAVGTVEYRSMTESVRRSNPLVDYVEGSAVDVDPSKQTVKVELVPFHEGDPPAFRDVAYDRLVVACGVRVNDGVVTGASEYCYKLKECDDAVKLRRAVSSRFETAVATTEDVELRRRLLTFVVVGGGPTGVELAGELSDFIKDVSRRFPTLDPTEPRVVLIHAGQQVLQQFEAPQRAEGLRVLRDVLGVEVVLGAKVKAVEAERLSFRRSDGAEEVLPYGVAIWCAGTAPQPFMETLLSRLPASAARGRFLAVDDWLRVNLTSSSSSSPEKDIRQGSILALGDCARLETPLPATAQVAAQQGAFVARFLNRNYDLAQTPPTVIDAAFEDRFFEKFWLYDIRRATTAPTFDFLDLGQLAYLGAGNALAEVSFNDFPLGAYVGSTGYLLWKSVYVVKQVATRNRLLITFDWLKAFLFGRDITRL